MPPPFTSSVPSLNDVGEIAPHGLRTILSKELAHLLGRDGHDSKFPGAQPVSFVRKHLADLRTRDYYVCEKSDGVRCLIYFTMDRMAGGEKIELHYLIDRKNDYYYVPRLHFPKAAEREGEPPDWASFHTETLLDGELLWDVERDGSRTLKYLVFDCLLLDGMSLLTRTLDKRLAYFMEKIYRPYAELRKKFPEDCANFPLILQKKDFQLSYGTELLFKEIMPKLPHGNDGVIFTCKDTPYRFGTDENILKWKPKDENTIDYKMELGQFPENVSGKPHDQKSNGTIHTDHSSSNDADPDADMDDSDGDWEHDYDAMPDSFTLHAHYGNGDDRPHTFMHVEPREWQGMKQWSIEHKLGLDGQIVECHLDSQGRWRFNRFRDDKMEANHYTVVEKVMASIEDGVSQEELIAAAASIRTAWKEREKATKERERAGGEQQQQQRRMATEPRRKTEGEPGPKQELEQEQEQGKPEPRFDGPLFGRDLLPTEFDHTEYELEEGYA